MIGTAVAPWLGLAAAVAWGQINYFPEDVVTNDDGSQMIFASSLRLRGSDEHLFPKLFLFEGGSFRLLAQRDPPEALLAIHRPDMSGDGAVFAYTAEPLRSQPACGSEREEGVIVAPGRPEMRLPGRAKLSRNGRFALLYRPCRSVTLVDLVSGGQTSFELSAGFDAVGGTGRRAVASDGTVVFVRDFAGGLAIARPGRLTFQQTSQPVFHPVIDDQATTVVYETPTPNYIAAGRRGRIMLVDIASGAERELAQGVGPILEPTLSNDGELVVFLSWTNPEVPQVFVINRDGSGLRQLTREPDGVAKAALSGNGRVVYAVTTGGLVRRIEVNSGEVQDVAGRVPRIGAVFGAVPGSLIRLSGLGLAGQAGRAAPPLPTTLGGIRLSVGGIAAPLLMVSPREIWAQIPWEAPVGAALTLEPAAESPFEGPPAQPIRTTENDVSYVSEALHADFHGALTHDDPAWPGEIVHLYVTGLGPVNPPVPTGAVSPANPPAVALRPPACRVRQYLPGPPGSPPEEREWPAEIVFAGLAPGLVGIYQLSLRVPPGPYVTQFPAAHPDTWLWCQYGLPPATLLLPIRNLPSPPRSRRPSHR